MSYLIAARFYFGPERRHYRTLYFRDCVDAQAHFVPKQKAVRLSREEARTVSSQLTTLYQQRVFLVMDERHRPPRMTLRIESAPHVPVQLDAFPEKPTCFEQPISIPRQSR